MVKLNTWDNRKVATVDIRIVGITIGTITNASWQCTLDTFKIQNYTIIDLGIQIQDELMTNKYEVEYKKAIKKIMKKLKRSKHNEKK